jgi:hypothetical protein
MNEKLYELQQRIFWYIDGIGIHGLSWELYRNIPTKRLVELYNIEIDFFKNKTTINNEQKII